MQCDKGCTLIALSPIQRTTLLDLTLNRHLCFDLQSRASGEPALFQRTGVGRYFA